MNNIYIFGSLGFLFTALFAAVLFTRKESFKKFKKIEFLFIFFIGSVSYLTLFSFCLNNTNAHVNKEVTSVTNNVANTTPIGKTINSEDTEEIKSETKETKVENKEPKQEKPHLDNKGNGLIKGNTNKKTGEKIYHVPGSTYYDRTKIEDTERWFKTVEEAEKAGYRAPKR